MKYQLGIIIENKIESIKNMIIQFIFFDDHVHLQSLNNVSEKLLNRKKKPKIVVIAFKHIIKWLPIIMNAKYI